MQDVTCFGRSLLLCLWSPWGWEEAPFSPCLCWHGPPQSNCFQEFAQAGSCSSLLSLSFGAGVTFTSLHPVAAMPEDRNLLMCFGLCAEFRCWGEREICWEDDAAWGCLPLGTRLLSHKNRWCLRGPSRPGILAILPWGASEGWVLLSTVCIRGL